MGVVTTEEWDFVFEPRSWTIRKDGAWKASPSERRGGLWASVEPYRYADAIAADRVAREDAVFGAPDRHFYAAGSKYAISERVAKELIRAGLNESVTKVPKPVAEAKRTLSGPVRSAAEAALEAKVENLEEHNRRIEERFAELRAKYEDLARSRRPAKTKEPAT